MHTRASSRPKAHRKYAHALKATRHTHRIKALFCFFFCTAGIDLLIFLDSNMILTMHLCVAVPNEQQRCEAVAALAGGRVCQHVGHGMPGKLHLGVLFMCTCLYVMGVDCSWLIERSICIIVPCMRTSAFYSPPPAVVQVIFICGFITPSSYKLYIMWAAIASVGMLAVRTSPITPWR